MSLKRQFLPRLACYAGFTLACTWLNNAWAAEPVPALLDDASAGQAVLLDRQRGHCLLCHQISQLSEHPLGDFQGNIGPDLSNVGNRLTAAQLRARVAEPLQANPQSVMPSYHLPNNQRQTLSNVAEAFVGQPILDTRDLSDLVAFLEQLKDPQKDLQKDPLKNQQKDQPKSDDSMPNR